MLYIDQTQYVLCEWMSMVSNTKDDSALQLLQQPTSSCRAVASRKWGCYHQYMRTKLAGHLRILPVVLATP